MSSAIEIIKKIEWREQIYRTLPQKELTRLAIIEIITMEKIGGNGEILEKEIYQTKDEIGTDYEIQFKTETAYECIEDTVKHLKALGFCEAHYDPEQIITAIADKEEYVELTLYTTMKKE